MRRIIASIVLILFLSTTLSACYDSNEVEEYSYVYIIGLDKGVKNALRLTVQIHSEIQSLSSAQGGNTGTGSGKQYTTLSIDAPSFFEGVQLLNTSIPRKLNFMQAKLIVISDELAKEGVAKYLGAMVRFREIRHSMHIAVVKNSAMDFVNAFEPLIGSSVSKAIETFMDEPDNTGYFAHTTLNNVFGDIVSTSAQPFCMYCAVNDFSNFKYKKNDNKASETTDDAIIEQNFTAGNIPRTGGGSDEFYGTALFDGDKMVGELNGNETRSMLMLNGNYKKGTYTIKDPKNNKFIVSVDVSMLKKPNIHVNTSGDIPKINVNLELEGDILSIQSGEDYEKLDMMPVLEDAFTKHIRSNIINLISKCKSLNSDVFGFGDIAVMNFLTISKWENYKWKSKFAQSEVCVNVVFKIKRTGTIISSSDIQSSGGKK
jgi:spore germination protein KC